MQQHQTVFPIIVPLGFAGSRHLLPAKADLTAAQRASFFSAVEAHLTEVIQHLPVQLGMSDQHVLCGISQIAIGADAIFTRVCANLNVPQRIFLPQTRDVYLEALGPAGEADFSLEEIAATRELLASPHVIQERVVSDAPDRTVRFVDTNIEIIRESEVFVCLLRPNARRNAGGTAELLEKVQQRGQPVLEIRCAAVDGLPRFTQTRHNWPDTGRDRSAQTLWRLPTLPGELTTRGVAGRANAMRDLFTHARAHLDALAQSGGDQATLQRGVFRNAALCIIAAHLSATVCAVLSQNLHHSVLLAVLLNIEALLLTAGLSIHIWLHRARAVKSWATFRLASELSVSALAMRNARVSLEHLFTLPFPASLLPLLRTIHVLHLVLSKENNSPWEQRRAAYIEERLEGERGQIGYYKRELIKAKRRLRIANWTFLTATSLALATTPLKMLLTQAGFDVATRLNGAVGLGMSLVAVVFPMLAVAALSLAASFDLEARVHTYEDTLNDVERIKSVMLLADSDREFGRLALQAEREMLAETANWASRRSFTSVT